VTHHPRLAALETLSSPWQTRSPSGIAPFYEHRVDQGADIPGEEVRANKMRYQGRITSWKDDKGFGFITPNGGGEPVFAHIKSFANRQRRPVGNELVTYELAVESKGRSRAENVAFVGERAPASGVGDRRSPAPLFAVSFVAIVATAALSGTLPLWVLWTYLGASAVAFIAYAADKSAAMNDRWRTQESTLHLFGLLGGWPGALAAQRILRHKSKKASFQGMFWTTVVVNCAAFFWMLGSALTQSPGAV